jgi:hypothetical protein
MEIGTNYSNQQVPFMHGNNANVLRNATRHRQAASLEISLKPNQIGVNPLDATRKAFDHHKPAGTLSQLAKESLGMSIQQYP